ncbi:hypothetical protein [Corynebacterium callunae]|uniref:hypothetical protein n=1 Tax=Corynebacterium callunae TaxID=1721 RepID=UPI001FFF1C6A|nr:hypothetical protein [Corynebacterium callunae]MCK2200472.1 hypothetical protein [Corynebacterium callunae]
MGIKPITGTQTPIPADNVQNRWGDWQADLEVTGEHVGTALEETYSLANSANESVALIPLGYCAAWMDKNTYMSTTSRKLPFNQQLGVSNGAEVDSANSCIKFNVTGTWTVSTLNNFTTSPLGDGGTIVVTVIVRNTDGSINSQWVINELHSGNGANVGSSCTKPVVISQPGMTLEVQAKGGTSALGGTIYSSLSVVRSSLRTDNPGSGTVPDEDSPPTP